MNKYIFIAVLILSSAALTSKAFAYTINVLVVPSNVSSGAESTVTISATTPDFPSGLYNHFFLFSPSNISLSQGTGLTGFNFNASTTWVGDNAMPISNPGGTYTILDAANSADFTSVCGVGTTLASCQAAITAGGGAYGSASEVIANAGPGPSTNWLVDATSTAQSWDTSGWWIMFSEIAWFFIVVWTVVWFLNYY